MHHLVAKVTVEAVKDYDPPHVLKKSASRRLSSMENVKRYEQTPSQLEYKKKATTKCKPERDVDSDTIGIKTCRRQGR